MMPKIKYNIVNFTKDNKEYRFVTRGRSKPFTPDEISQFLESETEAPTSEEFTVSGTLRRIFAQDLRSGLNFCSMKYGVPEASIMKEATRLFPSQNIDRIIGKEE